MIFYVERETDVSFSFDPEKTGALVAEAVLEAEGCPFEAEICLLLTDEEGIRELNRLHRKLDAPTDVLSFPALSFDAPAAFEGTSYDKPGARDPETGAVWLGDIAVYPERVLEQAKAYGHGAEREFAFLVAHSMLHLIGYDHADASQEAEMIKRQERVLEALHFTRE